MLTMLEKRVMESIEIPEKLRNNLFISTKGLGGVSRNYIGGVFLNYRSNTSSPLAMYNSLVQLTIFFNTSDNNGRYTGEEIGFEVTRSRNIKPPRGVKVKKHYTEVVAKVNKWIKDNEDLLYSYIENK